MNFFDIFKRKKSMSKKELQKYCDDYDYIMSGDWKKELQNGINNCAYIVISNICKNGENIEELKHFEKIIYFSHTFEAEVNNGGFRQFFFSSAGDYTRETLDSLFEIGAYKTMELLEKAISIFPSYTVPKNRDERKVVLDEILNVENEDLINKLDKSFIDCEDNLVELQYNYFYTSRHPFS